MRSGSRCGSGGDATHGKCLPFAHHLIQSPILLPLAPPSTPYTSYPFCPPLSPSTISRLCPSLVSHSSFGNDMTQWAWARHGRIPDHMAGLLSLRGVRVGWGGRGE
jgi:hypothetical protein